MVDPPEYGIIRGEGKSELNQKGLISMQLLDSLEPLYGDDEDGPHCPFDGAALSQLGIDDDEGFLSWEGLWGCSCGALYVGKQLNEKETLMEYIAQRPGSERDEDPLGKEAPNPLIITAEKIDPRRFSQN